MSKQWKPGKRSVELDQPVRVSRIRRDPPPAAKSADSEKKFEWWQSDEWEMTFAIAGIVGFALAIDIIIIAISVYWN